MTDTIIAIGGENLIDRVQTGETGGTPDFANNPGGSPFNVAIALARQGGQVAYLTPVSTDDRGDLLADRLESTGVVLASPRRDEPTTLAIVTLKDGIPSYEFRRDGTAERQVTEDSLQKALPAGTKAFHIGSLSLIADPDASVWEAAVQTAHKAGLFVSIDPNVRASLIEDPTAYRARLERLFKVADLIKLSDEDLEWLYPDLDQDAAFDALVDASSAALVVLTKGPDGAKGATAHYRVSIEAPTVHGFKDSIGAGDTFMGTLLATLAAGDDLDGARVANFDEAAIRSLLRRAAQAAALNCAQEGCNPPSKSELETALI